MRLIEYYIRLFITYAAIKTDYPTILSRQTISNELECSERNVNHVLSKMEENHWIKVIRGRGRGNKTKITFFKKLEEMFELYEEINPKTEDIERLISILENNHLLNKNNLLVSMLLNKLFSTKDKSLYNGQDENESLKIPYYRSLYSMDPALIERQTERHIVKQIFNTLVTYNEEKNEVESSLAHYWEMDRDGKIFTFYLRKGVTFHNSRTLIAEDVQFTFERLKHTPSKWIVQNLATIKCIGKYVIQFTFTKPSFHWIHLITSPKCSIIPNNYANKSREEFARDPIGTGPYKIQEHSKNFLKLWIHDGYFKERAHIEEIAIFILPSIEKYLNINVIDQEPIFYIPFTIKKNNDPHLQYIERKRLSVKYLMWNMKKQKIRTKMDLRKIIATIINKERMVNDLGYPRYEPASSFIKQCSFSKRGMYNEKVSTGNFKEPLTLMTYDLQPHIEDAKWIQKECKKHGITIEIKPLSFLSFIDQINDADLVLSEYVTEEAEEASLYNLVASQTGIIDNLIDSENKSIIQRALNNTFQQEKMQNRIEMLKKVDRLLNEECISIPLYWTFQKALYDQSLMGVSLSTIGLVPFNNLFYRKT